MNRIESELWQRAGQGDSRAFAEIFDLHNARIYRHVARQLSTVQDAEDATASTFLELWRLRSRVRLVDGSVLPWLLVTATNVARNLIRSRSRHRKIIDRIRSLSPAEPTELQALESDAPVLKLMRELPPQDAALLSLTALEGYSVVAAALALDLKPETARVRLHRLRGRMQRRLTASSQEIEGTV